MEEGTPEGIEIVVGEDGSGQRLDRFLPLALGDRGHEFSRAVLQNWVKEGFVLLNGSRIKPRHAIETGDVISVEIPAPAEVTLQPEEIELSILFEDDDLIVVNKTPGLVVHPGSGNETGTLVQGLLHHCEGRLSRLADGDRPGIVHRLDKDTSGCLVAAKSDRAYESLVEQFSQRHTRKEYLAATGGIPREEAGEIRNRIGRHPVQRQRMTVLDPPGGKEAATDYRILSSDETEGWALLSCLIHTGRTHQIRVHLKENLGCPILGDVLYGPRRGDRVAVDRLMLHAWKLSFDHPADGQRIQIAAPIPSAFAQFSPP